MGHKVLKLVREPLRILKGLWVTIGNCHKHRLIIRQWITRNFIKREKAVRNYDGLSNPENRTSVNTFIDDLRLGGWPFASSIRHTPSDQMSTGKPWGSRRIISGGIQNGDPTIWTTSPWDTSEHRPKSTKGEIINKKGGVISSHELLFRFAISFFK